MHAAVFTKKFRQCADALQTCDCAYASNDFWSDAGSRPLDLSLSPLADLYWEADNGQRQQIRDAVDPRIIWELLVYIRRVAVLIEGKDDVQWLRRGLAIAAIVSGREDYRDLIVSLVILRQGAERVGIKTQKHFNDTIKIAEPAIHGILENARDHGESGVDAIISAFGSPQWHPKRST